MRGIKSQAIKGVSWSAIERFSVQGVNFLLQIILARLLMPSDYGLIGMLAIFIQIAQVFIDSGFANALIQKHSCTDKDYSTVFYYNILISVLIYILFFFCSPLVASFYGEPILTKVMRVISITLIINALPVIHKTILVKQVDFKTQTKVSIAGAVTSGLAGIFAAYAGCGVWALCVQQIVNGVVQLILYIIYVRWHPTVLFDKHSFKELFGFGSKLLAASLIGVVYRNLYTIVIGKKFSSEDLGYYTRAEHFAMFPSNNLANIISRVAFPIFSKIQNDNNKLKTAYSKFIKYSSFIIFPLMVGLLALTEPLILSILTEKWLLIVPIMQILCIDWMLDHISVLNLNLLYVKGRSDLALRLEIIKKTVAIIILVATVPFGLIIMCWGRVIYSIFATILNTYYTNKLLNYSFLNQLKDFSPFLFASAIMGVAVYVTISFIEPALLKLSCGIIVGIIVYVFISICLFRDILAEIISMIKR